MTKTLFPNDDDNDNSNDDNSNDDNNDKNNDIAISKYNNSFKFEIFIFKFRIYIIDN